MPSFSEILDLISRTNKISIIFFVITCILLAYELYVYQRDKKKKNNPNIPTFNTQTSGPQIQHHSDSAVHRAQQHTVAPPTQLQQPAPTSPDMPPVIAQMKPPTMANMGMHKKKKSKSVPILIGATAALAVLTIAIAYKLNQPSSQEPGLTSTGAKAAEPTSVPSQAADLTAPSSNSTTPSAAPTSSSGNKILSLNKTSPAPTSSAHVITPTPSIGQLLSPTPTGVLIASGQTIPTVEPTIIVSAHSSSGSASVSPTTTIAPTLPVTGTIQYSIGVFALASIVMLASLLF